MKTSSRIGIAVFAILGLASLTGALLFNAPHHFVLAILCAMMVAVYIIDLKKEREK